MSDTVSFGPDIVFPVRTATVETIFSFLRKHYPGHPEFAPLLRREQEFESIGGWFFDALSLDALHLLQQSLHRIADDSHAATHWREEWRPVFYSDLKRFREKLAQRIEQLKPPPT